MKLLESRKWAERYFEPDSEPDSRTVAGWVEEGIVPGRRVGKKLYIDVSAWERQTTGNALADRILHG